MNSDFQSFRALLQGARQPWRAAVCSLALLGLTCAIQAGEKIRITQTPGEKVDLPKNQDLLPSGGVLPDKVSPGESGQGPVLPSPNQPSVIRNPKFEEWLDRKRNWIYETPNDADRDKALKQMFGVRDYDFTSTERKPKKMVEQYFDSTKEKKNSPEAGRSPDGSMSRDPLAKRGQSDPTGRSGDDDELPKRDNPGIIPELNPAILFNPNLVPDALTQAEENMNRNPLIPRSLNDNPIFGQRGASQGPHEPVANQHDFNKIWDTRNTPLGRINDPINQPDPTRALLNPTAARKASAPAPDTSPSRSGDPFGFGAAAAAASRPDLLNLNRSIGPSTPSFMPAAPAPVSAPMTQPKPGVLEIPRPRF